jgi:hypothetical protein
MSDIEKMDAANAAISSRVREVLASVGIEIEITPLHDWWDDGAYLTMTFNGETICEKFNVSEL